MGVESDRVVWMFDRIALESDGVGVGSSGFWDVGYGLFSLGPYLIWNRSLVLLRSVG